jgi:hypothetical protein
MRALVLTALMAGCAGPAAPAPSATVARWLAANAHDDPHAAYPLLADSVRRATPEKEFAARWRTTVEERRGQAAALGPLAAREHAEARFPDGRTEPLARDPEGWRLLAPRPLAAGAATPEEAVRRFAAALEQHDFDGLLALLADPLRSIVERELADRLTRVRDSLNKEIKIDGAHARIRFDQRYYLDLTQENGRWRISDFN